MFAPADMRAQRVGLFEGHPDWRDKAFCHCFAPQHQNIDTAIRHKISAQGPLDAPGGVFNRPWLVPRLHAGFQRGDNLLGYAFINILFHCLFAFGGGLHMQPTSQAAMSGVQP